MIRYFVVLLGLIACLGVLSSSAQAKALDKIDAPTVARIIQEMGYSYQVKSDYQGKPRVAVIDPSLPSKQFEVYFFDCDKKHRCESITLWSWYRPNTPVNYFKTNIWNKKNRWVRSYLDKDFQPVLEMDIHARGGIGLQNLRILMNAYVQTMTAYAEFMYAVDKNE